MAIWQYSQIQIRTLPEIKLGEASVAELFLISEARGAADKHVIFVHGLSGHHHDTWRSLSDPNVCWPQWLAEDMEGIAVWTIGYHAAVSRWRGSAMDLTDRATNVLARILGEPELQTGELILIGHSLGGLVIKQLLRVAEGLSHQKEEANNFIRRVRRVAFLATPHSGAALATWGDRLRIFIRPSASTACLARSDPHLRDLNSWYRVWSGSQGVANLILVERRPVRILGLIVNAESGDPGLSLLPIPVDEDHITIAKPIRRKSEVYIHIRDFIARPNDIQPETVIEHELREHSNQLKFLSDSIQDGTSQVSELILEERSRTAEMVSDILKKESQASSILLTFPKELVDNEIQRKLTVMRRARFFVGFSVAEHALELAERILSGELQGGSHAIKSSALAWCARFLAIGEYSAKSDQILSRANELGRGSEITIAEAFSDSAKGRLDDGLAKLASLDCPVARSAALFTVALQKGATIMVDWLATVGFKISDLDVDGKFLVITKLLELGQWTTAFEHAKSLEEEDFRQGPVLLHTAAMANLVQAIPPELRSTVLQQIPFDAGTFPLAADEPSIRAIRMARDLFSRCAPAARELGCEEVANAADDYVLWLDLRDPSRRDLAKRELEASMRESAHSLRRLPMALQFGLTLDLEAVEREIEQQIALSGGKSLDAALARFSLALSQPSAKGMADYIDQYRDEWRDHLHAKWATSIEIEVLALAGLQLRAEERLAELIDQGLTQAEEARLRGDIAKSKGVDLTEVRKEQFESSGLLNDLVMLVALLEERRDWANLCHYRGLLFERTRALSDAERLAMTLETAGRYSDLAVFLRKYPLLLDQSDTLQMLWSWSLYRQGLLKESAAALESLRAKRDQKNDRILTVRLAIASGNWKALLPFIEEQWERREEREASELMVTAELAHFAGSPRAKDFVYYAVDKAGNSADILAAAYGLATKAGWEDEEAVALWLGRAIELSDKKGPLQKMSMKDLLDRAPEWNRREVDTWQQVYEGGLPVFCAAHVLNQSLVDLFLFPALGNPAEADPRKHVLVPAYSGVRQPVPGSFRVVAMDPTALLTLSALGLLETTFALFERVLIPHSTLAWLFEENKKVSFHQPSRIRKSAELRNLLSNGGLKSLDPSEEANSDLAAEVGHDLASLIAEAFSKDSGDERQRIVIRPFPVHRVGSLMDEAADLSPYYAGLSSCLSIVNKLRQTGQLTATAESRALAYLQLHEKEWPSPPEISDGAVLYLDDLSVSYLQNAGLLAKLRPAGLEAHVAKRTTDEINALLRFEHLTAGVSELIESIRSVLADGIQTGKVRLGQMIREEDLEESTLGYHPTFGLLELANDVQAIIVDDRSMNKHGIGGRDSQKVPILTTMDLLGRLYSTEQINLDKWLECRTRLRRAGYLFIPVTKDELSRHLSAAEIFDGRIVETAELKAIRENLLRIRMSRFLQLPNEAQWISNLMAAFKDVLKSQWQIEMDEAAARARSDWLLAFLDARPWAHCFADGAGFRIAEQAYGAQIMSLLSAALTMEAQVKEKYSHWVDERVLENIRDNDPKLYSWIINRTKNLIAQVIENDIPEGFKQ